MPEPAEPRWLEFDDFLVDTRVRVLWRRSRVVPVPPKALDTLVSLLRHVGDVVLKQDLIGEIWPDTSVEETGLAHNIWVLRKALGPAGRSIKTVPKRGYRFTGTVRSRTSGPEHAGDAAIVEHRDRGARSTEREPPPVVLGWCSSCERHVWTATVDEALHATGASTATLGRFLDRGAVHFTDAAPAGVSLCMPSFIQALATRTRP